MVIVTGAGRNAAVDTRQDKENDYAYGYVGTSIHIGVVDWINATPGPTARSSSASASVPPRASK